jgi:hypothetical protein
LALGSLEGQRRPHQLQCAISRATRGAFIYRLDAPTERILQIISPECAIGATHLQRYPAKSVVPRWLRRLQNPEYHPHQLKSTISPATRGAFIYPLDAPTGRILQIISPECAVGATHLQRYPAKSVVPRWLRRLQNPEYHPHQLKSTISPATRGAFIYPLDAPTGRILQIISPECAVGATHLQRYPAKSVVPRWLRRLQIPEYHAHQLKSAISRAARGAFIYPLDAPTERILQIISPECAVGATHLQ